MNSYIKNVGIVTLFPDMMSALTQYGVSGRAIEQGKLALQCWNPRDYAADKHRTVDDRPYGGGPGMVMRAEPLKRALAAAKTSLGRSTTKVVYVSPQGRPLDQEGVAYLASQPSLIFLAGRYEGVDERLISSEVDEEWSLGDFVISGGELAIMVMLDAMIRLIPGALGHADSAQQDSFMNGLLDCPHYTRPVEFAGQMVPDVLMSGNHADIARWRLKQALGRTWERRPDLLASLQLDSLQKSLLEEYQRGQDSCIIPPKL